MTAFEAKVNPIGRGMSVYRDDKLVADFYVDPNTGKTWVYVFGDESACVLKDCILRGC